MKVLLQRVKWARVRVGGKVVGEIDHGLLAMVGCVKADQIVQAKRMAERIVGYRVFPDDEGKTNLDLRQVKGAVLVVSQFTLGADTRKGRRPSFDPTLAPGPAKVLIMALVEEIRIAGISVSEGVFGAEMELELLNYGPATYSLEVE